MNWDIRNLVLWCLIVVLPWPALGRSVHFVNVLYRHGERSPEVTYPNSLYKEEFWPQGFGELSLHGIQMQHSLGQYLRDRYGALLNSSYNRYEIHVRSTDLNRTLMSAQSNLAGLYPPRGDQIWNPTILWQPIPVHTESQVNDYLLGRAPCPKFDILFNQTIESDRGYLKLSEENANFLRYVSQKAGFNRSLTVIEAWFLQDPLFVESFNNLTTPEWATDNVMNQLQYLVDQDAYYTYNTKEKSKLRAGSLVGAMIDNMMNSQTTSVPENKRQKMYMYSAHGSTISAFLSALGVFNQKNPPMNSCVGLDFIQEDVCNPTKYTVEMWYRSDSQVEPFKLTLPGCEYSCPIQDFIKLTSDIIPQNILKECGFEPANSC